MITVWAVLVAASCGRLDVVARHDEGTFVDRGPAAGLYACPCCGYLTLGERGCFEICDVCFWEDDGQDDQDADRVRGGPNRDLSLLDARRNFAVHAAADPRDRRHVRPPLPEEYPPGAVPPDGTGSSST
ncbi:CPCC family cysteine-rich protein [Micromonospora rifamycinica]|uniref:Cysteine-rich CPCC n=1 Tax=Micromonospora rifamycinica TaxID=291594 RepID=A0A1C5KCL8_9ACTN|nr:CPCC family cysteine-rich protein [Micromonospora rifamycinica]SCG80361.1 Cysteine-rich CPCC [Micromonospora rifamycinica]